MTSSQGGGGSGGGGGGGGKYGGPTSGYHRSNYNDPRHHSYRHFTSRPNNDTSFSSDLEPQQHFNKRAKLHDGGRQDRLVETTSKSFMNNSSAVSTGSTNNIMTEITLTAEPISPQYGGGGLSQYISDIESDDDVDVVAQMDKQQQQQQNPLQQEQQLVPAPQQQLQQQSQPLPPQPLPPQPLPPQPLLPPASLPAPQQLVEEKPIKKLMDEEIVEKKEPPPEPVVCRMTKEELLLLMERVDHDIAKVELQVNVLKKKEVQCLCSISAYVILRKDCTVYIHVCMCIYIVWMHLSLLLLCNGVVSFLVMHFCSFEA